MLEESKAYYLIGFQPAEGRPGEREVGVRVRKEGLRVRARNRYYWGEPLPRDTDDSAAVAALRAMSDRTDVPFECRPRPGPRSERDRCRLACSCGSIRPPAPTSGG